jgi:hypothetical protein
MGLNWIIVSAIASAISGLLGKTYSAHSIGGFLTKNIIARGCSFIGTLISSLIFSENLLSFGGLLLSIIIASVLVVSIRGQLAKL